MTNEKIRIQLDTLFSELAKYDRIKEEAEQMTDSLKDEIKAIFTAESLESFTGTEHAASWKEITSQRFDGAALKKEQPALYAAYQKTQVSKRFTFK